jgi:hypothetical protein
MPLLLSPLLRFIKLYRLRPGSLVGVPGLLHVAIGYTDSLNRYAKLKALEVAAE